MVLDKLEGEPEQKKTTCARGWRFRLVIFTCAFLYALALLIVGIISYYMILSEFCDRCTFPYIPTMENELAARRQAAVDARSQLRLNHIQTLGTHNSYHIAGYPTIDAWRYTHDPLHIQLTKYGMRNFEFDLHYRSLVQHVSVVDSNSNCKCFKECLFQIRRWSAENPLHHTLFVFVEPADIPDVWRWTGDDAITYVDSAILSIFNETQLVRPDDVRGNYQTLRDAVMSRGWPLLGETRGKVMFVLFDRGTLRAEYLRDRPSLEGAVMFVDADPSWPSAAFIKVDSPLNNEDYIRWLVRKGFMVRTRSDDTMDPLNPNPLRAQAAKESGAHFVSTDFERDDLGYQVRLDDGSPTRCNPITAPSTCVAADIEALQL